MAELSMLLWLGYKWQGFLQLAVFAFIVPVLFRPITDSLVSVSPAPSVSRHQYFLLLAFPTRTIKINLSFPLIAWLHIIIGFLQEDPLISVHLCFHLKQKMPQ